jgi:glycosyltransferase involved in cell wall biosynthesis
LNITSLNKKPGNDWRMPLKLYRVLKEHNIDIVHTHSWGTLVEGVLGARLARIPVIIHGEHGSFPERWYQRQIQRILWGSADKLLSVSGELKKRLSESIRFSQNRIEVILNGVEEEKFFPSKSLREQFRKEFSFSGEDFIVGIVGRFSEVKNHRMLLLATAELIKQGEIIHIALVSRGRKEQELKEFSHSLGIAEFIHFLGFQSDVNMILNGFDIFALTSRSEGCSNVIQEAMFCQKPIIATNVGGNPELIENNYSGLLVEDNNHLELAEKIHYLKHHPNIREMLGKNARLTALKKFTLKKMVESYEDLYMKEFYKKQLVTEANSGREIARNPHDSNTKE